MRNTQPNTIPAIGSLAWATDLVGKLYESGSHGPDTFDCWGLVVYVYREVLGVELPDFFGFESIRDYPSKMEREIFAPGGDWSPIPEPEPFCGVAMSTRKIIHHVGVWLDFDGDARCWHAMDGGHVRADTVQGLKANHLSRIIFLRHKEGYA